MDIIAVIRDLGVPVGMLVWFTLRVDKALAEINRNLIKLLAAHNVRQSGEVEPHK